MNKKDVKLFVGTVLTVISILMIFWNVKLEDLSMPIQHKIGIDKSSVNLCLGKIREIRLKGSVDNEIIDTEISIYKDGEQIWANKYLNCRFENNICILESFAKESPLIIPEQGCEVEYVINGKETTNIELYFIEYSGSFQKIYLGLCLLIISAVIIVLFLGNKINIPLEVIYLCLAITLGALYNFVLPPLSVPDEQAHFLESYKLSSMILGSEIYDDTGKQLIRVTDNDAMEYLHNIASIAGWYNSFEIKNEGVNEMVSSVYGSTVATKAPHAYLVSAIVISIARVIGLSGNILLILGRLGNLLLFSVIVAYAIKLMPYGKEFFFLVGVLPETIYLFTSYSYDGLNLALCMLIIAYFLYLYHRVNKIGIKEILILTILIIFMIPIKVVYIVYGCLVFLLPREKVQISKQQMLMILLVVVIGIGMYTIASLDGIVGTIGKIESVESSHNTTRITVGYILNNLGTTIEMYVNTILQETSRYIADSVGTVVGKNRFNDNLGYDYYLLMKDENNHFTIFGSINTIKLLQINNIQLIPIQKTNPKYTIFLEELLTALKQESKQKEVVSRK